MAKQQQLKGQLEALSNERLAELAQDPQNHVYKYETASSASTTVATGSAGATNPTASLGGNNNNSPFEYESSVVISRFRKLRKAFDRLRKQYPHWTDYQTQLHLQNAYPQWQPFLETFHTTTVFVCSGKNTTEQVFALLKCVATTKSTGNQETDGRKFIERLQQNGLLKTQAVAAGAP